LTVDKRGLCPEQIYNADETVFIGKLCHVKHLLQPLRSQLLEEKNVSKEHHSTLLHCHRNSQTKAPAQRQMQKP
jgi:hypothetical protein